MMSFRKVSGFIKEKKDNFKAAQDDIRRADRIRQEKKDKMLFAKEKAAKKSLLENKKREKAKKTIAQARALKIDQTRAKFGLKPVKEMKKEKKRGFGEGINPAFGNK
jgi:hypothetical protein